MVLLFGCKMEKSSKVLPFSAKYGNIISALDDECKYFECFSRKDLSYEKS
ncbi:MAG: hypothetical protein K2H19_06705 [Ruminococcus sp.]|nr:hypothetical protein [Ruminococcus sp.]